MKLKNFLRRKLNFIFGCILSIINVSSLYAQDIPNINIYSQFASEQRTKEADIAAPYTNEIAQLAKTAQTNAQALDIQAYVSQLQLNSHNLINSLSEMQPMSSEGEILIFVSSSMPPASLQQWFNQAQRIHAAFILRGFVNNSLLDTKSWVKQLMMQNNKKGGIQIDPIAFERYGIQQVPAVVVTSKAIQCPPGMSCMTPPFDVVYGNMSLSEALKIIANQGNAASGIAMQVLNQIGAARD